MQYAQLSQERDVTKYIVIHATMEEGCVKQLLCRRRMKIRYYILVCIHSDMYQYKIIFKLFPLTFLLPLITFSVVLGPPHCLCE
jgi:hypothetical protein